MNLSDAASIKIGTTDAIEVRLGSISIWSPAGAETTDADFLTYDGSSLGTIVNPAVRSRLITNPRRGETYFNDSRLDSTGSWYSLDGDTISSSNTTVWLQIDLGEDQSITGLITQAASSYYGFRLTKYRVKYCDEASIQFSVSGMASNTSSDTYFNSSNVGHYEANGTYNGKVQYVASGEPKSVIRYTMGNNNVPFGSPDDKWEFVYDGDVYYISSQAEFSNPWAVRKTTTSRFHAASGWEHIGSGNSSSEDTIALTVDHNSFTDVDNGVEFIREDADYEDRRALENYKSFEAFAAPVTARYVTIFPTATVSGIGLMMRAGVAIDGVEVALTPEFSGSSTVDWGDLTTDNLVDNTTISHVFNPAYNQPTYAVTTAGNVTDVNEGSSVTFNVTTTNIADGTTLYYRTQSTRRDDFSNADYSGGFTITNNQGSFTVTPLADGTTESGNENFYYQIRTGSISGNIVATTDTITINDTSQEPFVLTYQGGGTSRAFGKFINEGDPLTVNVAARYTAPGTTLYWTLQMLSTNLNDADFQASSGDFTIGADGTGSFTITPIADATTEGTESFRIEIRTGSTSGPVVYYDLEDEQYPTRIIDTSEDGDTYAPTYNVNPASGNFGPMTSIDEGNPLTMVVTTTNVPDGTTLYWTIGNNASEFGTTSGDFTINSQGTSGEGTFTVTPLYDQTTEGAETFTVQIRTGSISGTIVDTSDAITINDTSTSTNQTPTSLTVTVRTSYYNNVASRYFVVQGSSSYNLSFIKGTTYTFDVSDSSNSTHPLSFSETSGGSAYSGVSSSGTPGQSGATVTLAIDQNYSGNKIWMYCTSHGVGMGQDYNGLSGINVY